MSDLPSTFLWGVATSAYQIEGATTEDGRGPTDWDAFVKIPGNILAGDTADIAADHYHRLDDDLDLMVELGVDCYRFSIAWTRIFPEGGGRVNARGLGFYDRLIDGLVSRGITPFPTTNHMELPLALAQRGGWLNRDVIDLYVQYALTVHEAFRDRVDLWSTMNEIAFTTWSGYGGSAFPPALDDRALAMPALHTQLVAHGRAVELMRQAQPAGRFGIVGSYWPVSAAKPDAVHREAAELVDLLLNRCSLDVLTDGAYPQRILNWHKSVGGDDFILEGDLAAISQPLDYFGLNYYAPVQVLADDSGPGGEVVPPGIGVRQADPDHLPKTTFNWTIDPDALLPVLRQFRDRYRLPVIITENGAAFDDVVESDGSVNDVARIDYLDRHLDVVSRARAEGVDIRGYMAWSLLDNFEWAQGYSKRFGLTFVDYRTQQRIPKRSFQWYRSKIRQGADSAAAVQS